MTVVFREEALADLDEIAQFIAQYDRSAADRVIARIHRTIYRTIAVLPLSGRRNPANNTREYAVPGLPYLVIYLPTADGIDVVAVFHTARTRPQSASHKQRVGLVHRAIARRPRQCHKLARPC